MLPMRFFGNRTFTAANLASLVHVLRHVRLDLPAGTVLQTVQGYSPLSAGLRILPWTVMPIFVAPLAGALSDRIGGRPLMVTGLTLQAAGLAWLGAAMTPGVAYSGLVAGFVISGIGMALFFAPVANVVLGAVRPSEEGQASGANNAIREAGGVFGVAVLASVFGRYGGYESGQTFVDGLSPAIYGGAGVVFAGALAALAIPRLRPTKKVDADPVEAVISRCACAGCWGRRRSAFGSAITRSLTSDKPADRSAAKSGKETSAPVLGGTGSTHRPCGGDVGDGEAGARRAARTGCGARHASS
jgi:MFS family permease